MCPIYQLDVLIIVQKCLRMIIEQINFFPDGGAEPIDQVAWMRLKQGEEYLVHLLVEANQLWYGDLDVVELLDVGYWECLDSRGDAVLRFHHGVPGGAVRDLLLLVDACYTSLEVDDQVGIQLDEVKFQLRLVLLLQPLLNRKLQLDDAVMYLRLRRLIYLYLNLFGQLSVLCRVQSAELFGIVLPLSPQASKELDQDRLLDFVLL